MRAVRHASRGIEVDDVPAPTGGGLRVQIRAAGICGSDLHMLRSGPSGVTPGHELAGTLPDGTPVAIEPMTPCGECEECTRGDYHLCRLGPEMMIGIGRDGGMAEEIVVPERSLVHLPEGLRVEDASLVEPMAVAVHGLRLAGLEPGARVAVVGGGTIGLCAVAAARASGCEVGLTARHRAQQNAGEKLGAVPIEGHYDVAVEAAGTDSALDEAVARCRPGAALVLLGVFWGPIPLQGIAALMKELRILPSLTYSRHRGSRDIDSAAAILAARPEVASALITHRFPLEEAREAFEVAADRASGAIKVVLEPS